MNSGEQARRMNCRGKHTTRLSPRHGASAILLKMDDNKADVLLDNLTHYSTSDKSHRG